MNFNPNLINIYIEASTKENLIKLQALTNQVNGKAYNYQTPTKEKDGYIVWFFADWQNHRYTTEKDLEKLMPTGENLTTLTQKVGK